jgi:hypothetical protein
MIVLVILIYLLVILVTLLFISDYLLVTLSRMASPLDVSSGESG